MIPTTTFIRADLKMRARQSMNGNWGILIPVTLIMQCLSIVNLFTAIGSTAELLISLANIFLCGAFSYAGCIVFLKLSKQKPTSLNDFFAAFADFGKSLPLWGLMFIKIFLWSLLFIIPGIVKTIAYSQAFYIKAENPELSAGEVLALSEKMTYGYKMDIFVLYLSFAGWYLLSLATFYLVGLYALPYLNMTLTELYFYLNESYNAQNSPNKTAIALETLAAQAAGERENAPDEITPAATLAESDVEDVEIDEYSEESSV